MIPIPANPTVMTASWQGVHTRGAIQCGIRGLLRGTRACQDRRMGPVDDYLAALDEPSRATVGHLYDLARREVPEAEQGTSYGMPALIYRGKPLLSVMRAKTHVGIYPYSSEVITTVADRGLLDGVDHAKGTVRMPVEHPVTDEALRALVAARRAQIEG
jgi:uncharacterized protein YdhG (YjbR/CyaY superfamily)